MSDLSYHSGSQIYVIRACTNHDAQDLLAIGGEHSVQILLLTDSTCTPIASFHIGSRITALAWSLRTVSPTNANDWYIELTAASSDFGLHLLSKSPSSDEYVFAFGGGLSGHHGKVNDMTFCGGGGEDSSRYVATVSDDKMLMVWDLHPSVDISSNIVSPNSSPRQRSSPSQKSRPQPTAYVIPFPHPLLTISAHVSTSKEFLVSDGRGSIFLIDWRTDPAESSQSWRNSSVIELVEPYALSQSTLGLFHTASASVAWRQDTIDIIGANFGSRFSVWDLANLHGGKPFASGPSFPEGGHRFRWCHTYPEYFAISSQSPAKGAIIHVYNVNYLQTQPTIFSLYPRPHLIRDFDFLAHRGIPRIAAAVGSEVVIFSIGTESS